MSKERGTDCKFNSEVVATPNEVNHTSSELGKPADLLKSLDGEARVSWSTRAATICRSPNISKGRGANYALDHWLKLTEYVPEEDLRQLLKTYNRQYAQYTKISAMLKNNLFALLDQTFPGVNTLFSSLPRKSGGYAKWFDFTKEFCHCECVYGMSEKRFASCFCALL